LYSLVEIEEWIGLLPNTSGDLREAALEYLRNSLEGKVDPEIGIIIAVLDADVISMGTLPPIPGDPKVYYLVKYRVLTFKPVQLEVIRGRVREAREIGIFVNMGPIDGFVFRNQIMDEPVEFLPERRGFRGVKTGRIVEVRDIVRARITQIGKDRRRTGGLKVGLTMRQPYLGKEEWIQELREREKEG